MSDTVVVMNEGIIQQVGTPEDIYNVIKNMERGMITINEGMERLATL